jgi:hypothetical protein
LELDLLRIYNVTGFVTLKFVNNDFYWMILFFRFEKCCIFLDVLCNLLLIYFCVFFYVVFISVGLWFLIGVLNLVGDRLLLFFLIGLLLKLLNVLGCDIFKINYDI